MNGFGSMLKDYLDYYKISQTDFALRLGISLKHMNEILNENTKLSEELMLKISLITDIDVNLIFYVENKKRIYLSLLEKYNSEENIKNIYKDYYINEMVNKKWLVLKDKESFVQTAMDLLEYLKISDFQDINKYLEKKFAYKKNEFANLTKIYLWIKHCDKLLVSQIVNEYNKENFNKLLEELKIERMKKFNKKSLIKLFNKYGIYLVIEDALTSTKIRGCTTVKKNNPAIYITTYLKEKSSFYYVLYHELAHIKTDYNKAKNAIIIDSDNESKMDTFALNEMITPNDYELLKNNRKNINKISKAKNIPLCFIYSRLAHDKLIKYNSLEYIKSRESIN